MCGRNLKAFCLGSALLLLLSPVIYSVDIYPGEKMFQIPESELEELEKIFEAQQETIVQLQTTLRQQHETIGGLQNTLIRQQTTISRLETSFDEYESAVRRQRIRTMIFSGAVGFAIGAIVSGAVAIYN